MYHLAPSGQAGFVLAKGSLTSKTSGEGEIRKNLIKKGLVDCIVNLPAKLFLNTQIPASLWFISRKAKPFLNPSQREGNVISQNSLNNSKKDGAYAASLSPIGRDGREGKILFIDARNMGHLINRRTRELSKEDIQLIADTYHNWRNPDGDYEDVKGFCNAASIERIKELDYVLTPGRYVGLADEEDDFNFNERFTSLKSEFEEQLKEETILNKRIAENLAKIELKDE